MDMNEFYLMMVLMAAGCFGLLGYVVFFDDTPSYSECLTACQSDGWQYKPKPHGEHCWCDVTTGLPLTSEGE